jgi:hypothetical protein
LAGLLKGFNQASGAKTAEAVNRMNSGGGASSASGGAAGGGSAAAAPAAPRTSNANSGQGVKSRDF